MQTHLQLGHALRLQAFVRKRVGSSHAGELSLTARSLPIDGFLMPAYSKTGELDVVDVMQGQRSMDPVAG